MLVSAFIAVEYGHMLKLPFISDQGVAETARLTSENLVKDLDDPEVARLQDEFRIEYEEEFKYQNEEGWDAGVFPPGHRELFDKYVEVIGANGILDVLEESYCHEQACLLGRVIQERLRDLGETVRLVGRRCTADAFHCAVTSAILLGDEQLDLSDIRNEADRICTSPDISVYKFGNCVHVLGAASYMLDGDIERSLELAKAFETTALRHYFTTGVWAKYIKTHGMEEMEASLYYPCDTYGTDLPAACYRYKMIFNVDRMRREGRTTEEIARFCMGLDTPMRLGCFHGLGFVHLTYMRDAPSALAGVCGFGNTDDNRICIEGAIEKLADFDESSAFKACEYVKGEDRDVCLTAATRKMYDLKKDFSLYVNPG